MKDIKAFPLNSVTLEDEFFVQVTQKDVDFLNCFEVERLLYNFRLTAGLKPKAESSYSGWENTRIGGHTLGHYLAAAAQACATGHGSSTGNDGLTLGSRLEQLITGLAECQNSGKTGFIFGATMDDPSKPELQFDKIEQGNPAETWVPWYTMHKILNGLVEVAKLCIEPLPQTAMLSLEIAQKLGEWIYNRTSRWTHTVHTRVLAIEYGAMNDCLYELYKISKAKGYPNSRLFLDAAHVFDEEELFEKVLSGNQDVLNNKHANCTIPKFLGALNRYITLGDKKYFEYVEAFWKMVVNHHTYITGGNSECEHFGKDDILDAERSNCNCETCNTHNMLKITRALFMLTGQKKYADYYENTFINAILASVNRETGMTTYFQPMATGCFKTYCNLDVNKNYFWCCTGTGLENFTKLGDSIYFYDDDTLFVNQFVSSKVQWKIKKLCVQQKSDIPTGEAVSFKISYDAGRSSCGCDSAIPVFNLALRIPDWCCSKPVVLLNDKTASKNEISEKDGYIIIKRKWHNEDTVTLSLPMKIKAFSLPDNSNVAAFKYGPVVIAAELGRDKKMTLRQVGVQCDVCANKIVLGKELLLNGNYGGTSGLSCLSTETLYVESVQDFCENINLHFERIPGTLNFILHDTSWPKNSTFVFSPYYLINNQRYGIYWIFDCMENQKKQQKPQAVIESQKYDLVEGIGVGYGAQTEGNATTAPYMSEAGTGSVGDPHELTRYAKAGGSFSYTIKVLPDSQNFLECNFYVEDEGKTLCIKSGDTLIAKYKVTSKEKISESDSKIKKVFELPKMLTNGSKQLRITFSGNDGPAYCDSARLVAPLNTLVLSCN